MAILTGLLGAPQSTAVCDDLDYCTGAGPDGSGGFHGYIPQPPGFELPDAYSGPTDSALGLDPTTVVAGLQAGDSKSC